MYIISVIVLLAIYLWIAYRVPYTHDDWDWGLDIGIQQLVTANINSRYAGNFIEVVMTRSKALKTLIMGSAFCMLPVLTVKCIQKHYGKNEKHSSVILLLCSNIYLLTMNVEVWQQTYGWVAGFANFGISALFLVLYLIKFLEIFNDVTDIVKKSKDATLGRAICLFFSSIVMQLFLENITLALLFLSACALFISIIRTRKVIHKYIVLFTGNVLGALIMFSSNIYSTLMSTGEAVEGYRKLAFDINGGIVEMAISCIYNYCGNLIPELYTHHYLLTCSILMLSALLIFKINGNKKIKIAAIGLDVLWIAFYIFSFFGVMAIWDKKILFMINISFFITIACQLWMIYRHKRTQQIKMVVMWCLPLLLMAPLMFITTWGPRLFFVTNVILILVALALLQELIYHIADSAKYKILQGAVLCSILILFFKYGVVYYNIGKCTEERYCTISFAIENNQTSMVLPKYPHEEYLWIPDPGSEKRLNFFKEFYKIPESIDIVFE